MVKNKKPRTKPLVNGDASADDQDSSKNLWTQNFAKIAQYLVKDYRDKVAVRPEFTLFQEAMKIDVVVIIQEPGLVIDNAIMRSFKRHNIIEFKSPNDTLSISAFDKAISYFYAYLSNERDNEKPPMEFDDVTLTLISVRKPIKALKMLREKRDCKIVDTETPGIYYIIKDGYIPEKIQLVVSSELPDDESDQSFLWLRTLRNNLTPEEAKKAIKKAANIDGDDVSLSSVVRFILSVNPDILEEVDSMIEDPRVQKFFESVAIRTGATQKAAEERAKEMARKMIARNKFSADEIAEYTGLDIADIVMLQSAMV